MNFIISGKNIEVTAGLRETIEQKLGKLERYFTPETEITVTLSVEKERQKIEVTIPVKGTIIRSEQTSSDMYVSIDLVEEIIERQLRKYKNKLVSKSQGHPTSAAETGSIRKNSLNQKKRRLKTMKSASYAPNDSASNPCIRKMPACRWNSWGTAFSYFPMLKQMKSMSYIREKTVLSD